MTMANPQASERLWTRRYVLAMIVNTASTAVFYLFVSSMALYAIRRFDASEFEAGLTAASFVIGGVSARLLGGRYLDFLGRRRVLLISLAACVILPIAHIWSEALWLTIVVQMLHGIGFAMASTAITTVAFALIPATRRGEGAGFFSASTTLASALAPLLGVVVEHLGYDALFIAGSLLPAAGLAVVCFFRPPERVLLPEERAALKRFRLSSLLAPSVVPVASVMLLVGVGYTGVLSFLNPYSVAEGAAPTGGLFFAVFGGVVLISRLFIGRIQDAHGDNAVVYPLLIVFGIGLAILSITPTGFPLILSAVLVGIGFGSLVPVLQAISIDVATPTQMALATSTYFFMADLGIGLGPLIHGALIPLIGYRGLFVALGALTIPTILLYFRVHGHRARSLTS